MSRACLKRGFYYEIGLLGINFVLLQEVKVLVPLVADDLEGVKVTRDSLCRR